MNINGNFIIDESIITLLGRLVGVAEKISPNEEKQKAARTIDNAKITGKATVIPNINPIMIGTVVIKTPKIKEASISPKMIVGMVTGQDINLSSVFACVSHGIIAGEIAVEVKKRVIPSSPGIKKLRLSSLPIMKERNKKIGNMIPNITTGPFE